jgi:signal transduction histidine kinase
MQQETTIFPKVLLLEDEAAHAMLIERALRGVSSEVIRVSTLDDACRRLAAEAFDLIVSDLHVPGVPEQGPVGALRKVAAMVPLIVLTSSSSVSDGVAAMRAGADDFLVKNFDANFKDVLHLALSRMHSASVVEREKALLTRDRDILQLAVENSDDGLAVVEPDGRVRHCNSSFRRFLSEFNAREQNVISIDADRLLHGESILATLTEKLSSLTVGAVWTTEVESSEGEEAYDISLSVAMEGERREALVLWVRDTRERKRREKFQREILSTTTHDLKGPLGAISISCDVLLDKELQDKRTRDVLERISSSANSAIHLIEEFLSARRIEEGTFVLRPRQQEITPILERCLDTFRLPYETRGIKLSLQSSSGDLSGCIDSLGLERVVSNLLSNGIKFTPRGGAVQICARRVNSGLLVSVSDTGAGMEPSEAQTLFQRYSRLSKHAAVPGAGLGLFIVKSVVSAHAGSVDVTSAVGQGTTFDLFFPDASPVNERGEVLCLDFA